MHRKLFAAAAMSLLLLTMPFSASAEETKTGKEGDFSYTVLDDGTVSVSCDNPILTEIEVPARIDGHMVSTLAEYCFADHDKAVEIILPEGLINIGEYAFSGCAALETIEIPATVTNIGSYAFDSTTGMTAFSVSEQNIAYTAQDGVLFDKAVRRLIKYPESRPDTAYAVPDTCEIIADWAFIGSQYLEQLDLKQVNHIGEDAFYYCVKLKNITIPEGVVDLIGGAFCYCVELESVTLPSTLKTIGENCFYSCTALKEIELPQGLEKISPYAFFHCTSLSELTIPKSIITMTECCVGYCYDEASGGIAVQEGFTLYVTKGTPARVYASSNDIAWKEDLSDLWFGLIIAGAAIVIAALVAVNVVVMKKRRREDT